MWIFLLSDHYDFLLTDLNLFGKQEYGGNLDQAVNAHFIELEANAYGIIFFNDTYICKKNHRYFILFYFISISRPQLSKKWIVHSVAVCFFFFF